MAALKWTVIIVLIAAFYYWFTMDRFDPSSIGGQRVLITGTSSGIGEELAYAYSKLGARVLITARRQTVLETVARRCLELGARQVKIVAADMADADDRRRVIVEAEKAFDGRLDHLILNHVTVDHAHWKFTPSNVTRLRQAYEVNFFSYVEMTSLAAEMLIRAGGRIGVISSVAGKVPMASFAYYSSIKFALNGFFLTVRQELLAAGSNISVTSCVLGLIATEASKESIRKGYVKVDEKEAASVENTAEAIMRGVSLRVREVYYPLSATLAVTMHKFFPDLVERISAQLTF